jgi:ribosomal protein L37E
MWLCAECGFFSVTQKKENEWQARERVAHARRFA